MSRHNASVSRDLRCAAIVANPTCFKTPAKAGVLNSARRGGLCTFLLAAAWFLSPFTAAAQFPQVSAMPADVDSVPQTTVVPVVQPPVHLVERSTVYQTPTKEMDRAQRRGYRAKVYAAKIDSLVQSRDYLFYPNTMQEIPGGLIRTIYAGYYYLGMFIDHVEVHLPTERGFSQYVEMLNFDSMSVRDYRASKMPWGWTVWFTISDGDELYHAELVVSTVTGETILTLITPQLTMRYVGWLWDKKIHDSKYYDPH